MAPLADGWSYAEWNATYNAFSFGIAAMGCATIFFWLQLANVSKSYRTALIITGIVTCIATYHYFRIFNSWVEAFKVVSTDGGDYTVFFSRPLRCAAGKCCRLAGRDCCPGAAAYSDGPG